MYLCGLNECSRLKALISNKVASVSKTSDSMRVWWLSGILPRSINSKGGYSLARYHVGVDVGKVRHHVCVRDLSNDTYCRNFSVSNDQEGLTHLVASLGTLSTDHDDFLIGVESCPYGLNVSYFLMSAGFNLVEVNTFRAGQFRKAQGKKAKTDRIDARCVAAILSLGDHKPLCIPEPILDNLRELTHFRSDLVNEKAMAVIHLREALSILFPEFDKVFRQLDSAGSLALLVTFPGPEHVITAGEERVGEVLSAASPHRMGKGMARRIIEAAERTVGVIQKQPALGIKISTLAKRIADLQSTIRQLDRQITALFNTLPTKPEGFPVGRAPSLATIMSEIGDIRRFPTLKKFLSYLGWCPQTFQTGNYRMEHPRMSHAGNKYVRRLIWMLSVFAVQRVPRYREYFHRRVSEGKAKMHILVAVGRKLLSVLYSMLKTGATYDPNWEENRRLAPARH
jgi:transposase